MDAKEYTRMFNLVSTRSVGSLEDISYDGFDLSFAAINYGNCVNLYEFIKDFSRAYQSFKKDYSELKHLWLLRKYRMAAYYETVHSRNLRFIGEGSILNFICLNGNYKIVKVNTGNVDEKQKIKCDEEVVKAYLDFGRKYADLINRYNIILNDLSDININNDVLLSLKFNKEDITKLKSIAFAFGMYTPNFEVTYNLNKGFTKVVKVVESSYDFKKREVSKIAQGISIDKSFVYGLEAFKGESRKLVSKNTIH